MVIPPPTVPPSEAVSIVAAATPVALRTHYHSLAVTDGRYVLLYESAPTGQPSNMAFASYEHKEFPRAALDASAGRPLHLQNLALRSMGELPESFKLRNAKIDYQLTSPEGFAEQHCHVYRLGKRHSLPARRQSLRQIFETRPKDDQQRYTDFTLHNLSHPVPTSCSAITRSFLTQLARRNLSSGAIPEDQTLPPSKHVPKPDRPQPRAPSLEKIFQPARSPRVVLVLWRSTGHGAQVLAETTNAQLRLPQQAIPQAYDTTQSILVSVREALVNTVTDLFDDANDMVRRIKKLTLEQFNEETPAEMVVPLQVHSEFDALRVEGFTPNVQPRSFLWLDTKTYTQTSPTCTATEREVIQNRPGKVTRIPRSTHRSRRARLRRGDGRRGIARTNMDPGQMLPCPERDDAGACGTISKPERLRPPSKPLLLTERQAPVAPLHLVSLPPQIQKWHQEMDTQGPRATELPTYAKAVPFIRPVAAVRPLSNAVMSACSKQVVEFSEKSLEGEQVTIDPMMIDRLVLAAKDRARSRGSMEVTPRDVRDAADVISHKHSCGSRPEVEPEPLPDHWIDLQTALSELKIQSALLARPVRVLVLGETRGVVARMFCMAGAEVATCDLSPSECDDIPHFQGDAAFIQDQGFDLVIGHPPCTYLSNAGGMWLTREVGRIDRAYEAAALFRRFQAAKAPFVALEQPIMHRLGRSLTSAPTQIVHPWQHGTGQTKPTALHLSASLPPLQPACVVPGRERVLANLPARADRGHLRSRTYQGIAAAMAVQWMPTLINHVSSAVKPMEGDKTSVKTLVDAARDAAEPRVMAAVTARRRDGPDYSEEPYVYPIFPPGLPIPCVSPEPESPVQEDPSRHLPAELEVRTSPAAVIYPAPPITQQFRRRQGRWQAWVPRSHQVTSPKWQPVNGADEDQIEALSAKYSAMVPVYESNSPNEWDPVLRRQWALTESSTHRSNAPREAGLGFEPFPNAPADHPLLICLPDGQLSRHRPGQSLARSKHSPVDYSRSLADVYRTDYESFRPETAPLDRGTTLSPADASLVAAARTPPDSKLTRSPPRPWNDPLAPTSYSEADVVIAPEVTAECAYLEDFVVSCTDSTRHRSNPGFLIDRAKMQCNWAIADSGAGPSVITDEMLELIRQARPDASVHTTLESQRVIEVTLVNLEGSALLDLGQVSMDFTLSGIPHRQTFRLVEGAPLLVLGNDFIAKHNASVNLLRDSTGYLEYDWKGNRTRSALSTKPPPRQGCGSFKKNTAPLETTHRAAAAVTLPVPPRSLEPPSPSSTDAPLRAVKKAPESLLYSKLPIRIESMQDGEVWLDLPLPLRDLPGPFFVEPVPSREGIDVHAPASSGLVRPVDGRVPVRLWNLLPHATTVPTFSPVARITHDFTLRTAPDQPSRKRSYQELNAEERELVDAVTIDPDQVLTDLQRTRALDLLASFVDVLAENPKSPHKTHLLEVDLPLRPDVKPHCHASSRHGDAGRLIVDAHCAEMEANGIIRKSNSAWGSRVVLITKSSGDIRFCVDYRDTNSKLQTLDSPIPRCDEAIDRLASGKGPIDSLFLSTLDLASGFWTMPIAERDKHVTAFVTHRQKYEFNYLPFGIQSGPSWMCRLIDAALSGLAWETCVPYLDDAAVWSTGVGDSPASRQDSSFEQMMVRLTQVFERFRWAGLSPKASKTTLFATAAPFLGHVVGRNGLSMDPKKIAAVKDIDPTKLTTLLDVRSFLGLTSYYRKFVDKFAEYAAPLHDLTKIGVDIEVESQSPKCQAAFIALIDAITTEPVLAMPRFDREFTVKTDGALTHGIGGVLVQLDDDGKERPVAFAGRRLSPAERNYSATEVELLGVIFAIKQWRGYLWGKHFKIVTDHSALRWLHTMKDTVDGGPASRLTRWSLKLQEYDFEVIHKPGRHHHDADAVSRLVGAALSIHPSPSAPDDVDKDGQPNHLLQSRNAISRWAAQSSMSQDEMNVICAQATDYVLGHSPTKPSFPSSVTVVAPVRKKKEPSSRAKVTTARSLQAAAQAEAALETSRDSIVAAYTATGTPTSAALRLAQRADPDCSALMLALVTGGVASSAPRTSRKRLIPAALRDRWIQRQLPFLVMRDGVLHRVDGAPVSSRPVPRCRPWVPDELRYAYLVAFHDRAGHQGVSRTTAILSERFYWPGMQTDVQIYVGECHECTFAKRLPSRIAAPTAPGVPGQPFDTLVIDLLDMAPTADGLYDKCVVMVDSLSRWPEVIPCLGEPTSEQLLDMFMTHVVCRHGAPRCLRHDLGGNLASQLTAIVMEKTGIDLSPSTAHHHQSAGVAERLNGALVAMCRAANQGGAHWVDHLPFLLFSYRATPHRVTRHSPAMLLYGRELRLPAQLDSTVATGPSVINEMPKEIQKYVQHLEDHLRLAWNAARESTVEQQLKDRDVADQKWSRNVISYKEGDFVCTRIHDKVNKLQWQWSGPYRVLTVLADSNYILMDLENRNRSEVFNAANLRPYRTNVDAEALASDEHLVDFLLDRRGTDDDRTYRVKWRHYPRSQTTWEPVAELMRRCQKLVEAYDAKHPLDLPQEPQIRPHRDADGTLQAAKILLCIGPTVFAWKRRDSHEPNSPLADLDLPGGSRDHSDLTIADTLVREVQEEIHLPPDDLQRLRDLVLDQPEGCHERIVRDNPSRIPTRDVTVHVWALRVPTSSSACIRPTSGSLTSGSAEGKAAKFYPRDQVIQSLEDHMPAYALACKRALAAIDATSTPSAATVQPPPQEESEDDPHEARYLKETWTYARRISTHRGMTTRWYRLETLMNVDPMLLKSLRDQHVQSLPPDQRRLHTQLVAYAQTNSMSMEPNIARLLPPSEAESSTTQPATPTLPKPLITPSRLSPSPVRRPPTTHITSPLVAPPLPQPLDETFPQLPPPVRQLPEPHVTPPLASQTLPPPLRSMSHQSPTPVSRPLMTHAAPTLVEHTLPPPLSTSFRPSPTPVSRPTRTIAAPPLATSSLPTQLEPTPQTLPPAAPLPLPPFEPLLPPPLRSLSHQSPTLVSRPLMTHAAPTVVEHTLPPPLSTSFRPSPTPVSRPTRTLATPPKATSSLPTQLEPTPQTPPPAAPLTLPPFEQLLPPPLNMTSTPSPPSVSRCPLTQFTPPLATCTLPPPLVTPPGMTPPTPLSPSLSTPLLPPPLAASYRPSPSLVSRPPMIPFPLRNELLTTPALPPPLPDARSHPLLPPRLAANYRPSPSLVSRPPMIPFPLRNELLTTPALPPPLHDARSQRTSTTTLPTPLPSYVRPSNDGWSGYSSMQTPTNTTPLQTPRQGFGRGKR